MDYNQDMDQQPVAPVPIPAYAERKKSFRKSLIVSGADDLGSQRQRQPSNSNTGAGGGPMTIDLATAMENEVIANMAAAESTPARFRPSVLFRQVEEREEDMDDQLRRARDEAGTSPLATSASSRFFATFSSRHISEANISELSDTDINEVKVVMSGGQEALQDHFDDPETPQAGSGNNVAVRCAEETSELTGIDGMSMDATMMSGVNPGSSKRISRNKRRRGSRDNSGLRKPKGLLVLELQKNGMRDFKTMGAAEMVRYIQGSVRRVNHTREPAANYSPTNAERTVSICALGSSSGR